MARGLDVRETALLALAVAAMAACVQGRQMCYTCSYNQNPIDRDIECVRSPADWKSGHPRMKCEYRCIITSIWNKETGNATYMFRGCSGSDDMADNNCVESELEYHCSWSCVGDHFCNEGKGRTLMKDLDKDGAASLAAGLLLHLLLPLVTMAIVKTTAA